MPSSPRRRQVDPCDRGAPLRRRRSRQLLEDGDRRQRGGCRARARSRGYAADGSAARGRRSSRSRTSPHAAPASARRARSPSACSTRSTPSRASTSLRSSWPRKQRGSRSRSSASRSDGRISMRPQSGASTSSSSCRAGVAFGSSRSSAPRRRSNDCSGRCSSSTRDASGARPTSSLEQRRAVQDGRQLEALKKMRRPRVGAARAPRCRRRRCAGQRCSARTGSSSAGSPTESATRQSIGCTSAAIDAGATAGKILGAGAGGFLLLVRASRAARRRSRSTVAASRAAAAVLGAGHAHRRPWPERAVGGRAGRDGQRRELPGAPASAVEAPTEGSACRSSARCSTAPIATRSRCSRSETAAARRPRATWRPISRRTPSEPNMRRFRVISLNDNTAILTALANDLGYENVFREQLQNLIRPGDLLIAISASGNSANVLNADPLRAAAIRRGRLPPRIRRR